MAEMDAIKKQLTADDLLNLPDDGKRYELIEGELVEMSPAGYEHGSISAKVISKLVIYCETSKSGRTISSETGFRTRKDDNTVRAPDAAFTSYNKIPRGKAPQGFSDIAPELVVEVISPNDRTGDIENKTQEWLDFGVLMVCNIYPRQKSIHIFQPDQKPIILFEDDIFDGGDILPEFRVNVSDFFEE